VDTGQITLLDAAYALDELAAGLALIRRGKTDAEEQGRVAYLSRATVRWLKVWLEHAEIGEGSGISSTNRKRPNRRPAESWEHRADL
jgi:hypothetical protein